MSKEPKNEKSDPILDKESDDDESLASEFAEEEEEIKPPSKRTYVLA